MNKKAFAVVLILIFIGSLNLVLNIQPTRAEPGTIYIRADGSIEPSWANISTSDFTTYAFSGNNNDSIWVERSNITIDGNGFMLRGFGSGCGFNLSSVDSVTIENMNINGFQTGILLDTSSNDFIFGNNITENISFGISMTPLSLNNTITENNIAENKFHGINMYGSSNNFVTRNKIENNTNAGICLSYSSSNYITSNNITANNFGIRLTSSSSNNVISGNYVTENNQSGVYLTSASNNQLYHNNFIGNNKSVYIAHSPLIPNSTGSWDNNVEGNYWSDYGGDCNLTTGIGLTPYIIDMANQDNYPLMNPYLPGDYNHDGTVDMTDADLVKVAWHSKIGDLNYNPHVDFNMDGVVNIKDATIIGLNWQKHA